VARAVYIAPSQALATERLRDWSAKFGAKMGLNVVELAGEPTSDHKLLEKVGMVAAAGLLMFSVAGYSCCAAESAIIHRDNARDHGTKQF
jgi:hypothetical protein